MSQLNKSRPLPRLLLFAMAALTTWVLTTQVRAEAQASMSLFTLQEVQNMSVSIQWDTEEPEISFQSPDGKTYEEGSGVVVQRGDHITYYLIANAAPGSWFMSYNKLGNAELDVNWVPYYNQLIIEGLRAHISGDRAEVDFTVTYERQMEYTYIVYVVVEGSDMTAGRKTLLEGTAQVGESVTVQAPLDSLSSYGAYSIMVEAYLRDGGMEVGDTAVSAETFAYSNSRQPQAPQLPRILLDLTDSDMLIDWSETPASGCQGYVLAVYAPMDSQELYFTSEYDDQTTATSLLANTELESYRVELAYRKDDMLSAPVSLRFQLNTGTDILIRTEESTNAAQAVVEYSTQKDIAATVAANGAEQVIQLSGQGEFSVPLQGFDNEVTVTYSPYDQVTFLVRKGIYIDKIPPILSLYENDWIIRTTASTFLLAGKTEPGCTLQVGGEVANLNEDGTFLHSVRLSQGENNIDVTVADAAGNVTLQTIRIERQSFFSGGEGGPWGRYPYLLGSLGASMLAAGFVFYASRRYGNRTDWSRLRRVLAVLRDLCVCLTTAALLAAAYFLVRWLQTGAEINAFDFFESAQSSHQGALEAIVAHSEYQSGLLLTLLPCLGLLLLTIMLLLWCRRLAKGASPLSAEEVAPPSPGGSGGGVVYCSYCGQRYDQPVKFCAKCGKKIL